MKANPCKWKVRALRYLSCVVLLGSLSYATQPETRLVEAGKKVKVTGQILSRNGDLVNVYDTVSGEVVVVDLNASTKVERKRGQILFFRHTQIDRTALIPGLTIVAEGPGNAKGQIEADKIWRRIFLSVAVRRRLFAARSIDELWRARVREFRKNSIMPGFCSNEC